MILIYYSKNLLNKLLNNSYCIHLWETHLYEPLLNKISPSYFNIYNTPLSNIFLNIFTIISLYQFYLFYNIIIQIIYKIHIIYKRFNNTRTYIYIKYINNNNYIFDNIDDNYILLNTLQQKQIEYSKLNSIIYYTDTIYWKKYDNIKTYAFYNSVILNDLNDFNNIDTILTSSYSEINILKTITENIKYLNYPMNNTICTINRNSNKLIDFYNSIKK